MSLLASMGFLGRGALGDGPRQRRRADGVACNAAILRAARGGDGPARSLHVIKAVELAVRARCADNDDVVRAISAFVDSSPRWTLVQAAEAGLWRLVRRVALRDCFDAADPSYRQWVYTKALASAAGAGRLDVVQLLTRRFPGCYVTLAIEEASRNGHLSILKWLYEHHELVKWGGDEVSAALRSDHLGVAQWLHDNVLRARGGLKLAAVDSGNLDAVQWSFANDESSNPRNLLQAAVNVGNLEVVKWMIEGGDLSADAMDGIWLDAAACKGCLDMVKWLTRKGIGRCSETCVEQAGANGHLEVVKWIVQYRQDGRGEDPMDEIAGRGRLEVLEWAIENCGKCLSKSAIDMAAMNGHLDVVKYLHEYKDHVFVCSHSAMNGAAENGHLEVVQWLHRHQGGGCTSAAIDGAAGNGHLEVVKWLHENRTEGCTKRAMNFAAMNGHLHVVKWLHENRTEGCTIDAMSRAAASGHLNVVKFLHKNRREGLTSHSIVAASCGGHLEVLQWLHRHCRLSPSREALSSAMDIAAGNGFLGTVQWLASTHNACCSSIAMDLAARNGHFDIMVVMRLEFGCECSEDAFISAIKANELEILQWLCHHFPYQFERSRLELASLSSSPLMQQWLTFDASFQRSESMTGAEAEPFEL